MTTFQTAADLLADRDLEAQLVAALAAAAGAAEQVRDLVQPADFTDDDMRQAYAALLEDRVIAPPDGVTPTLDPIAAAKRIADLAGGRKLAGVPTLLGARLLALKQGDTTLADVLAAFMTAAARGVDAATPTMPLRPSGELLGDVLADAERRRQHREQTGSSVMGLRTGLARLDELTGGLEAGTMTVLLARPNAGKTTLVNGWAFNVAKEGAPVLFVSFENPATDLTLKHLVRLAGVSAHDVLRGRGNISQLEGAARIYAELVGDRLYYAAGDASTNVAAIATMAHRIRRRHPDAPAPLIVLDYLQKLAVRPSDDGPRGAGYDDLRGNVARVTQELRDLARALGSPVLTISSVNRAAYATDSSKPTAASAKESGSIEFDTDVLLALADDPKNDGVMPPGVRAVRLDILKNRYGPLGSVHLGFDGARGRFDARDTEPVRGQ